MADRAARSWRLSGLIQADLLLGEEVRPGVAGDPTRVRSPIGLRSHAEMHCPFCRGDDTRVVDSRAAEAGSSIRRRRECATCGRRFTTYERAAIANMVRKRDGRIEPFDGHKLRRGVERALAGRPVPEGSVDRLVADLSAFVGAQGGEVSADELGDEVLLRLRDIDEVAYLRFASVYREFQGVRDFEREVAAMEGDG